MHEQEVLALLRAGDERGAEALLRHYAPLMRYIIAPIVHSRSSQVPPLWTLLCVFAGGMLLGPIGIMISIPVFMSLRVIVNLVRFRNERYDPLPSEDE